MFRKIVSFFHLVAFVQSQKCPNDLGEPVINCELVPGCNDPTTGLLLPASTQCKNKLPNTDCDKLFICPNTAPTGATNFAICDFTTPGSGPADFPYVRNPLCIRPALRDIALQCARTCVMCCETPEYSCQDDSNSPINCEDNKDKCTITNWTDIMATYCPQTCGLCTAGSCADLNTDCYSMRNLCKHTSWIDFMSTNCARTCDTCSTSSSSPSPSSGCSDIASNCAANANLCTSSVYRSLMLQQCCATCSGTSGSVSSPSTSCSDTTSSCSTWVRNGFCSNTFYTTAHKRQYCARSCNLC